MLEESSHTATLAPGQFHQESKPGAMTTAAEADAFGSAEDSGKGPRRAKTFVLCPGRDPYPEPPMGDPVRVWK